MNQIKTYEIRLREEFKNLQKLQQHNSIKGVVIIRYEDRIKGGIHAINIKPSNMNMYPEKYFVTYRMPVFTGRNNLNNNWEGLLTLQVSKDSLLNGRNVSTASCELKCNGRYPFNHHISQGFFCVGGIWKTSIGLGIWYFILATGALINQEEAWLTDDASGHLDEDAYKYWKERNKAKVNDIKWPFNLLDEDINLNKRNKGQVKIKKFKIGKKPLPKRKTFIIGKTK